MAKKAAKKSTKKGAAPVPGIQAWQDDPMGLPVVKRPVPNLSAAPLKFKITGATVPAGVYPPGTSQFRYWTAAEAVRRGGDFWAAQGITKWQSSVGSVLPIGLDNGVDLNAYYDRSQLAFFHDTAGGKVVYSGESPDVVCHELGHACLDAHRPQLWNAHYIEVGSFHEAFGDMSAILSALQLPGVRAAALAALTGNKASVLSRCAEQLGWAIRQIAPTAVDADCLRNAWNRFAYVDPQTLPNSAPATQLCAEVHSFSRVFTGAFYEILSKMLGVLSTKPTDATLVAAARDMGALLMDATAAAPVKPNFFAQVAARMIDADTARFKGKYRTALSSTFVKRKILSATAVTAAASVTKSVRAALAEINKAGIAKTETVELSLPASDFGLGSGALLVDGVVEHSTSLSVAGGHTRAQETKLDDVRAAIHQFVSVLVEHNRLETGKPTKGLGMKAGQSSDRLHTHQLIKVKNGLKLERVRFLCGCRRDLVE
ncbi:MAG: hypothetical protein JSS02_19505 [Planctomycetes bacterium]|nr:hypothetical protein [Planctomycetota bacterium]